MWLRGLLLGLALSLPPVAIAADAASPLAVGYICAAERGAAPQGPRTLTRVSGVGAGGFPIATHKVEAQGWFDYGMALAHAFYHQDATLAFRRATEIDPGCAMCAWAEAWSLGPTLNFGAEPADRRSAAALTAKAATLTAGESAKNQALIAALRVRYSGAPGAADIAYADAMDHLVHRYPGDDEIAILAADAWLIPQTLRGDRQGVERAVEILKTVLERHPDNTGAIHFYIHATEEAGRPAQALPFADRLGGLAPNASHLVHMASHTFFRVGRYEDAALVNAQALAVDSAYLRAAHDATPQGKVIYHSHDLRFGLAGAIAAGDGALAVRLADHVAFAFPGVIAREDVSQIVVGNAAFAYGRFAPARALAMSDPGAEAPYASALRHYARGEAFAARGDAPQVLIEAEAVEKDTDKATRATPTWFHKTAGPILHIAALTLRGRAAMLNGHPEDAVKLYRTAAVIQDKSLAFRGAYDPPPWWYPVRRSVAAALLAAGDPAGAEAETRLALAVWPKEPLTLRLLGEAERAAGKQSDAERNLAEFSAAWHGENVPQALL